MSSFRVSAPGKVILFGEHSVVYGKTAFAASLGQRTSLTLTQTNSEINLILPLADINHTFSVAQLNLEIKNSKIPLKADLTDLAFNLDGPELVDADAFIREIRSIVSKLEPSSPGQESALVAFLMLLKGMFSSVDLELDSFRMLVESELVLGAGTGSSASYGVCLAASLYQYIKNRAALRFSLGSNISRGDYKAFTITNADSTMFTDRELSTILGWALVSDRVMHGNPSGVDATVILRGNLLEFRRGFPSSSAVLVPLRVLLVNTKVTRNTGDLVRGVAELRERYPKVVVPVFEAMDGVASSAKEIFSEMRDLRGGDDDEEVEDRLMTRLGELMDINQNLLRSLQVSHRSLDEICSVANQLGLAAKLTGAGGGGYAIVLLPPRLETERIEMLQERMEECGYDATLTLVGGEGLKLHNDV